MSGVLKHPQFVRNSLSGAVAAAMLSGCASRPVLQVLDTSAISAVQDDLKRQIGIYISESRQLPTIHRVRQSNKGPISEQVLVTLDLIPRSDPIRKIFSCGNGDIGFQIDSVVADLKTTSSYGSGINLGVQVPISVISLNPTYSVSNTGSNSQSLDFQLWPLPPERQDYLQESLPPRPEHIDDKEAPIAAILLHLRSALLASAMRYDYSTDPPTLRPPGPCFTDYNPHSIGDTPANNKYVVGLGFSRTEKAGIAVSASFLTLGANGELDSTTGNSLTVTFVQPGLEKFAKATAYRDKVCEGSWEKPKCSKANSCLGSLKEQNTGQGFLRGEELKFGLTKQTDFTNTNTCEGIIPPASYRPQ